jgi:hypothetical protein
MSFVRATALQEHVSGFSAGLKNLLKVRYLESGKVVYHRYEGGPIWMATVPNDIGKPGSRFNVSIEVLRTDEFVENIPPLNLRNDAGFTWLPDRCQVLRISQGNTLRMAVQQQPPVEGISKFDVLMKPAETLGFGPGKGCFLETTLEDVFGHPRKARIYHDGHSTASIGLRQGRKYPKVSFLSSDGIRLRIAYGSPQVRVASIYLSDPSSLYHIERIAQFQSLNLKRLPLTPLDSYRISVARQTESKMLLSKYRYPHGRIGSEIAYSIAVHELGLKDLVLNDPSDGGADMITEDGKFLFENRLVTITQVMPQETLERQIAFELGRLERRLRSDFVFYRSAEVGYAFLSFLELDGLGTMVFEMER